MLKKACSDLRVSPATVFIIVVFLGLWLVEKTAPHPHYIKVFYHLGRDAEDKGRFLQAEHYYRKVISLDPSFVPSYHRLGLIYEKKGDIEQARKYFEQAIFIGPVFPEVFYDLGMMLLKENNEEAVSYLERSLEGSSSPQFRYGLGLAYLKAGKKEKALDLVQDLESRGASDLAKDLENTIASFKKFADVKP